MRRVSDEEFAAIFEKHGAAETGQELGISERAAYSRRRRAEARLGRLISSPGVIQPQAPPRAARKHYEIKDGVVITGGDAHYWPNDVSTAHCAFVEFIKRFQPKLIVMNGDVVDGAAISRHPPIGWEEAPSVIQEIETARLRLAEIAEASPKSKRLWTLGNHDARYESRLAALIPEYANIHGVHLKDHFPDWDTAWSAWINEAAGSRPTVIKHRGKGGIHAPHNNTIQSGVHMVTNHLHSAKVAPFTDYLGTRYGVDTGTLAEPNGHQFIDYTEDGFKNWRSGFAMLTYRNYELMMPELVLVKDEGVVEFRSELIEVGLP